MMHRCIGFLTLIVVLAFFSTVQAETFEADYVPWSGYWWPYSNGAIVKGYTAGLSPLEKYDFVTTGSKYGPARLYGIRYYNDPDAVSWAGMCFFWAAASILEPEPVHRGIYKDVLFHVGDKKALVTAAYDSCIYEPYTVDTPEDFHQVLNEFIAYQKKPIIIDLGTNGEHWNYPVFKYQTDYYTEGNYRHYATTIFYATDAVRPDYVGTKVSDTTYYYYFSLDGDHIVGSGWEGRSVGQEPYRAFDVFGPMPRNKDFSVDEVRRISETDDDVFEENDRFSDAVSLSTGSYDLLAIDEDFFAIEMQAGDRVRISASSSFGEELDFLWFSPDFMVSGEFDVMSGYQFSALQAGTYYLSVVPDHPENEPDYHLEIDLELVNQAFFPLDPTGLWINNFCLTPLGAVESRVILSAINRDGSVQQSYAKKLANYSSIRGTAEGCGLTEPDSGYLRLDSDAYCMGLQIPTDGNYLMLGTSMMSDQDAGSMLFFPQAARANGWQTYFGLINTGDQHETIIRNGFDPAGQLVGSDVIELNAGQKVEQDTRYIKALVPGAVSMQAVTESGNECLIGYILYLNPASGSKGRAMVPLRQVSSDNDSLVIPYVLSNWNWWTGIAVMNIGTGENAIVCSAHDAEGEEIGSKEYVLPEMGRLAVDVADLFETVAEEAIASIRILSINNKPLSGLMLFGSSNEKLLAGMPIQPAGESLLYVPHIAESDRWWTTIGLMNAGSAEESVAVTAFDVNGGFVAERVSVLRANQCLSGSVTEIFSGDAQLARKIKYLTVESFSGQPLSGLYLIGSQDGKRLMGDVVVSGE